MQVQFQIWMQRTELQAENSCYEFNFIMEIGWEGESLTLEEGSHK